MRVPPHVVASCDEYRRASHWLRLIYAQVRPATGERRLVRLPGQSVEELLVELVDPLRIPLRLGEARALLAEGVAQKLFVVRTDAQGEAVSLEVVAFPPTAAAERDRLLSAGARRTRKWREKAEQEKAEREKAEREKTARDASRETVSVTPPVTDGETPAVTPSETSPVTSPAPVTPPPSGAVTASQAPARAPLPPPSLHPLRGMEEEGKGGARTHEAPASAAVTATVTEPETPNETHTVTGAVTPKDDLAVVGVGTARRFRTAADLAELPARHRGELAASLLREDGGKVFDPRVTDAEVEALGGIVRAARLGAEDLWKVAVCWRSCKDSLERMFKNSRGVLASGRVNAGFLLAPSEDRGRHLRIAVAAAEKWFREQAPDAQERTRKRRLSGEPFTPARTSPDDAARANGTG